MRILIVAEGRHELAGALLALVQRFTTKEIHCDLDRVSRNDIHAHHGKGGGYFKKALRWIREAEKRGYDALILLIDEDNRPERTREIGEAQNHIAVTALPRALGVAIRTFDAWMLGDEQALSRVLDYRIARQSDPETIRDPKSICRNLLVKSNEAIPQAALYEALMRTADIGILKNRCARGFGPFAGRIEQLLADI